ncbi:hypothetical protein ACVWXO_005648 [Bradyrhizobium sp. LM2.7]
MLRRQQRCGGALRKYSCAQARGTRPFGPGCSACADSGTSHVNARSRLRSKLEWCLARIRGCASAPRLLHLHNRPLHMRSGFQSSPPSRRALCHRPLRPIRRHRRMILQYRMIHQGAPQMRHHLQVTRRPRTRRQRTPTLQKTDDRCRRMTGPCRRHTLPRSVHLNARWLSRSARSTAAASWRGVSRPRIFRRFSGMPAGRHLHCRPGSRCALPRFKFGFNRIIY